MHYLNNKIHFYPLFLSSVMVDVVILYFCHGICIFHRFQSWYLCLPFLILLGIFVSSPYSCEGVCVYPICSQSWQVGLIIRVHSPVLDATVVTMCSQFFLLSILILYTSASEFEVSMGGILYFLCCSGLFLQKNLVEIA